MLRVYYTDHHEIPLPHGHKFPIRKYALLRNDLAGDPAFDLKPAPLATRDEIVLVHDPEYVDAFLTGTLDAAAMRRIGFPWSEHLVRRTLASVGATCSAAFCAMETGVSGTLAGGTHHAYRDFGSGFCVFNDIAVAIALLRERHLIERATVLDLDVHQGDGTASIFAHDPRVFTISVHGRNNFPFRKQVSKLDIDLPDGCTDEPFLSAVREATSAALEFAGDVLFFQSGVDSLAADRLGRLAVSSEALAERDRMVLEAVQRVGTSCVITLGGGYAVPIELTVGAHANTFRTAARLFATQSEAGR